MGRRGDVARPRRASARGPHLARHASPSRVVPPEHRFRGSQGHRRPHEGSPPRSVARVRLASAGGRRGGHGLPRPGRLGEFLGSLVFREAMLRAFEGVGRSEIRRGSSVASPAGGRKVELRRNVPTAKWPRDGDLVAPSPVGEPFVCRASRRANRGGIPTRYERGRVSPGAPSAKAKS